jgi:hypothetical protein
MRVVSDAKGVHWEITPPAGGFFGEAKPERKFRKPRPLTEAQRRELGFPTEPEPSTPSSVKQPKRRRASTVRRQALAGKAGPFAAILAAAVTVAETIDQHRQAHPGRTRQASTRTDSRPSPGTSASQFAPSQTPSRYLSRSRTPRTRSRSAISMAQLSCQHSVRFVDRPSELLGDLVECPQCEVKVSIVNAEPTGTLGEGERPPGRDAGGPTVSATLA